MILATFLLGILRLVIRSAIFILVANTIYSWVIFVTDQPIATEVFPTAATGTVEVSSPTTRIGELKTSKSPIYSAAQIESDDSNAGSITEGFSCSSTLEYSNNSSLVSGDTTNTQSDILGFQVNLKPEKTTRVCKPTQICHGATLNEVTKASRDIPAEVPHFATQNFDILKGGNDLQIEYHPEGVEDKPTNLAIEPAEPVQPQALRNYRPTSHATSKPQDTRVDSHDTKVDSHDTQVDSQEAQNPYLGESKDSRRKSETKKYRYNPRVLMQFSSIVANKIGNGTLESLGLSCDRKTSDGPQKSNSHMNVQSKGGRFNGFSSSRPGSFYDRDSLRGSFGNSKNKPKRTSKNKNGSRNKAKNDGAEKEQPQYQAHHLPVEESRNTSLTPTANRWVPRSRAKKEEAKLAPDGSILLEPREVDRKVNSALNKLTLEMFEPITNDLMKIARQSVWEEDAKTLKQVISLTFAKACDEPHWSLVYAQFCSKMLKGIPQDIRDVNTLTKTGEPTTGGDLTRRILLETCQTEYNKEWADKLPTNQDGSPLEPEMMSDVYYTMAAAKRRGLGLLKFIGHLYMLNMLKDHVILGCLRDQSKNVVDPSEDSLESLVQLVNTVGPRFENSPQNKAALNKVYGSIRQILAKCKLSSRIKCLLMDLQDLRKNSWKSTKKRGRA
ncbi:hypothetical protein JCM33374_g255 [Metschnikowia sp. JCM 33374]|nr:hypothetical protein JCM33374_g255 [Metschnikowia sp. JCM 33374]